MTDPYRPRVKVISGPAGDRLDTPFEVSLWEVPEAGKGPRAVTASLDPSEHGVDPLTYL